MRRAWVWGGVTGVALAWLGGPVVGQGVPPPAAPGGPPPIPAGAAPVAAPAGAPGGAPAPVPAGAPAAAPTAPAAPAAPAKPVLPAGVVAQVNGASITQAEVDAILKAGAPSPVHLPEAKYRQRQFEVLSLLIDNLLMHQYLDKNTAPVPPEEVNKRLGEMEDGLKKQGKSLAEFCHDTNQTPEQLRASVADHIRWMMYASTRVNEQAVEAYYRENKDFFDGVTVRASHIVLRIPATATEAEKQKAQEKLKALREQIVAGKLDFAEAAKAHSQDPLAAQGGDLGFFPRKWVFDEPFARAAFSLPVGTVSEVVATDYGYHLIKVTDKKAGKPSEYAKIKEAVREFCLEDTRQSILSQLRKTADIKISLP